MVRLLVRKSLLSTWTSSRPSGRRRAAHACGAGRYVHRRTVAAVLTAGDDDDARDIRLDALFCSCCCSSDDVGCCWCCVTDEECQELVDVEAVSRRRCRCARRSAVRRCSTRVVLVALLMVFFTLTTLYRQPSSAATYQDPVDGDTAPVVLLPAGRGSPAGDASGASKSAPPVLLAMPDCDAIVAGDRAEIASTQRMLFRETRATSTAFDAVDCTSAFRRPAADVAGSRRLAYVISDSGSDVEQTQLLLRAVYAAANVYCLTVDFCSSSDHVAAALRRLTACFDNVVTVDRARCNDTGSRSRDRKWNAPTTTAAAAWWRCVSALLRRDDRWTHVVSLTVGDFPLRPPDDVARRLATTEDFDVSRRTGNDVVKCGAYSRSAVSRPSTLRGDDSEAGKWSSITTSEMHSPDGASALEVCARKCTIVDDDDSDGNNARCYYTVADLSSLVRQRKLFAHAFNLNVDHYAVRCLMQRIVK